MDRLYGELGVARGASADEIKAAYKRLVMQHHPDRHATGTAAQQAAAAAKFKSIKDAYEVLSDGRKRTAYEASASGRGPYGAGSYGSYARPGYQNVNTDWARSQYTKDFYNTNRGHTARMSNWEFLRRSVRHRSRSLDTTLHIGLVTICLGGIILFDYAHNALWESRNQGKHFRDIQATKASESGSTGGRSGPSWTGVNADPGRRVLHSPWADNMRGRAVKEEGAMPHGGGSINGSSSSRSTSSIRSSPVGGDDPASGAGIEKSGLDGGPGADVKHEQAVQGSQSYNVATAASGGSGDGTDSRPASSRNQAGMEAHLSSSGNERGRTSEIAEVQSNAGCQRPVDKATILRGSSPPGQIAGHVAAAQQAAPAQSAPTL